MSSEDQRRFHAAASAHSALNTSPAPSGSFLSLDALSAASPSPSPSADAAMSEELRRVTEMIKHGTLVYGYAQDRAGKAVKRMILLFYSESADALYWCAAPPVGAAAVRKESPYACMPLSDISEVAVGKTSGVLQSSIGSAASSDATFTIVGLDRTLELETSNGQVRDVWVFAIQALLAKSGRQLLVNNKDQPKSPASPTSPSAATGAKPRRFSVLKAQSTNQALAQEYDLGDVLAMSASDLLKDIGRGKTIAAHSLQETIRMMENGHPAKRYYLENGVVMSRDIHLFYVSPPADSIPAGGKIGGTMCWSARGERVRDPASSLNLRYLKTVLLKKNTPTLKHPSLKEINKNRCFSLVANLPENGENLVEELNIELDSKEQVAAWLFGIHALVTPNPKNGPNATTTKSTSTLESIDESAPEPASPTSGGMNLKNVLSFGSTEDAIRLMEEGTEFQSYENSAAGINIRTILLFYAEDSTRLGSIYWCLSGTKKVKSNHRSIPLSEITDIYTGKQTRTFTAEEAQQAVEELSWSIIGKHDMLNLEASSKQDLATWLFGINRIITRSNSGKKMILEGGDAPINKGTENKIGKRRFSVKPCAMVTNQPPAPIVRPEVQQAKAAAATKASNECPLLYQGHVFTVYIQTPTGIVKSKQFVFYSTEGGTPHIAWCAPGFRVESELNRINLKSLTDVFIGHCTDVFKSPIARGSDERCCLSLVSKHHATLNFELDSHSKLKLWVGELTSILQKSGRQVEDESVAGQNKAASTAAKKGGRRMSIMPTTTVAGLPKTAHETAVGMNVKRRQSLLHLSTTDTVRTLQDGRRFYRYFEGANGVRKDLVTLFFVRDKNAFYWCAPGERIQIEEQHLSLTTLTDVYLGKQTPVFLDPFCAKVESAKCISLVDKRGTLNLESDTTEQLSSFLFGVQSLLNKGGRDVMVDAAAEEEAKRAAASASPSATAAGRGKRFSIMTANPTAADLAQSRYGNFKRALLAVPENENLKTMMDGRDFYFWQVDDVSGRVFKKLQHLYYVPAANLKNIPGAQLGAFYWCEVGAMKDLSPANLRAPTKRFMISELTDVFVGKQTAILSDPAAAAANSKCCVTFASSGNSTSTGTGASKQINLEALSAEQANSFLAGINSILTGNGMTVVLEESKSVSEAGRATKKAKRFSIMAPTTLPGVNLSDPRSVALANSSHIQRADGTHVSKSRATMLGVATHEAISTMEEGRRFTRYFNNVATGRIDKELVTLFYVKDQHTLYWSAPGTRVQNPNAAFKLGELSDVFLGKQTPVLLSKDCAGAPNNRCLSLLTKHGLYLDIEADTVEQLSAWLFAIQQSLTKTGKQCYVDTDTTNKPVQAPGQSRNKRFSVLGSTLEGVEQSRHANFKKAILTIPRDENLKLMTQGSDYWSYGVDPTSGLGTRKRIHLFYAPQPKSLFWCEPNTRIMDAHKEININAITDLYVGKMSKVFKLPVAAQADKAKSITIQTAAVELNIEGDSKEQVTALLSAINHLLNSNGMQVLIEEHGANGGSSGAASSVSSPPGRGERRYSIMPFSAHASMPKTAQETLLAVKSNDESLANVPIKETINMLAAGRRFVRYTFGTNQEVVKQIISLFYSKSTNSLFWCNPGSRVMDERQCIKLSHIRKVLLGKQTKVLKSPELKEVANAKCVAIVDSNGSELNIAAESAEVLSSWLFGLQTLVARSMRVVIDGRPMPAGKDAKSDKSGKAKASTTTTTPTLAILSDPNVATMVTGAQFLNYVSGADGVVTRKAVQVWYTPDAPIGGAESTSPLASISSPVAPAHRASIMPFATSGLPKTAHETALGMNVKRRQSILHLDTNDTMRMLEEGRRFTRYFATPNGSATKELITLFYVRSANAFYWSAPGTRTQNPEQQLSLNTLTDVYLGRQTPVFMTPFCELVDTEKCISLVDTRGTLDLESDTTEQLSSFLFGLQSLLNKGGRDVLVDAAEEAAAAAAAAEEAVRAAAAPAGAPPAAAPAGRGKRFSIMTANPTAADLDKSRYANFKRAMLAVPASDNFRQMSSGRDFYLWDVDRSTGRVSKTLKHFYYVSAAVAQSCGVELKLGAFYWHDIGGAKSYTPEHLAARENRFALAELTDVFVGKQTAILSDPAAAAANSKCCVTFASSGNSTSTGTGASKQINLEALSAEQANSFLAGINSILTGNGMTVVLEESKSVSEAGRATKKAKRFSIMAPAQLPGMNMSNPHSVALAGASGVTRSDGTSVPKNQRPTTLGVAAHEAIATMEEGRRFTRHFRNIAGVVAKELITLFYVPNSNTLFWSPPGTRQQNPESALKLSDLSDVFLGKQTPCMLQSAAAPNRCLSLLTRHGFYLDLEADTVEHLSAWLFGIQTVLKGDGKQVYVDEEADAQLKKKAAPGGATAGHRGKRFSILGSSLEGVEQSRHANFKKAILAIPKDENLRMMVSGSDYWVYESDSTGYGRKTKMHIFYVPQTGSIYWSDIGLKEQDPKREIPMSKLTDLYVGKMSKVFQLPIAAQADKAKCITIQSTSHQLNIEGESKEQVTALLAAINHLLNSNGMQVLIEETLPGAAPVGAPLSAAEATQKPERRYSIMPKSAIQAATIVEGNEDNDDDDDDDDDEEDDDADAGARDEESLNAAANPGGLGSVYFCDASISPRVPSSRVNLNQLTDLYNLHQSKLFSTSNSVLLSTSNSSRCLTFVTSVGDFDFEALLDGVVEKWLDGLRVILTQGGRQVEEVKVDTPQTQAQAQAPAAAAAATTAPAARRMSVVPSAPAAAAYVPPRHSSNDETLITSFSALDCLTHGEPFTRYMYDNWTKRVDRIELWLYYRESRDHLMPGSLHWTERDPGTFVVAELEPDSEHTLPISLDGLQSVHAGKSADVFLKSDSKSVEQADGARCLTLLGPGGPGMNLNLEAATTQSAQQWIQHINTLLARSRAQALEINGGSNRRPSEQHALATMKPIDEDTNEEE